MAIRGLTPAVMSAFTGKNTSQNLTDATPGTMLSAKNVMVLSDNQIRRAPGYTLVAKIGEGPISNQYKFERNVDQAEAHISLAAATSALGYVFGRGSKDSK
jgi:hypothetical protein